MRKRFHFIALNKTHCIVPKLSLLRVFPIDFVERELNSPFGFIYKLTNIENDKIYIGKTIQDPMFRFRSHVHSSTKSNTLLARAINKYGEKVFEIEILKDCSNNKDLSESERFFILKYKSNDRSIGYNMTLLDNIQYRNKTGLFGHTLGERNPMYGTSLYQIWVNKHGKQVADEKLLEFKEKQRAIAKARYNPNKLTFKGSKHSQKSKDKLSNDRKGSNNPMYGVNVYDTWIEKYGTDTATEMKKQDILNKNESKSKNRV